MREREYTAAFLELPREFRPSSAMSDSVRFTREARRALRRPELVGFTSEASIMMTMMMMKLVERWPRALARARARYTRLLDLSFSIYNLERTRSRLRERRSCVSHASDFAPLNFSLNLAIERSRDIRHIEFVSFELSARVLSASARLGTARIRSD